MKELSFLILGISLGIFLEIIFEPIRRSQRVLIYHQKKLLSKQKEIIKSQGTVIYFLENDVITCKKTLKESGISLPELKTGDRYLYF